MKAEYLPRLTVRLAGNEWKARINIHFLMMARPLADVRKFVRLYLWHIPLTDSNLTALRQIVDWFPTAIEAAKEQWKKASADYNSGFQTQHEYPFKPTRKQEQHNRKLLTAVQDAKKVIDRLERSKEVFLEECAKRHVPIDYLDGL